ncbi:MAG: alpha-ketoglutarate-dependent dioxygenase AlkB [Leptospiraceae bacterium]|nr:alpha-ketoglutarate-dependent dioxygenase AlkB [Leptospiraceae bacterium]
MINLEISNGKLIKIDLENTDIDYVENFLNQKEADKLFIYLKENIPWENKKIRIFGKWIPEPRLTAWYGDDKKIYKYSGLSRKPLPWIPILTEFKIKIEKISGFSFNSVLLNYYRNGKDSNDWHSDNEKELGKDPKIASLSLGVERKFEFKNKNFPDRKKNLQLKHGSLLLMGSNSQALWKHRLPKEKRITGERINLTFRWIF